MQITDVRVRKVSKEGKLKAVVSITIDDEFVVHDIKVIEGEKGLFIAMPSKKALDDGQVAALIVARDAQQTVTAPLVEQAAAIQAAARTIYQALDCRVFARVDLFLTPEGEIYFNEVNTIPGFTAHSRYPNMMKGIGLDFPALVSRLIVLGLEP